MGQERIKRLVTQSYNSAENSLSNPNDNFFTLSSVTEQSICTLTYCGIYCNFLSVSLVC